MLVAHYETKRALQAAIGSGLDYSETSIFGAEYRESGTFCVVGPDAYRRKWYAQVTMEAGRIAAVDGKRTAPKPAAPKDRKPLSLRALQRYATASVVPATDGCRVEPDGRCPHGAPSVLIDAGLI